MRSSTSGQYNPTHYAPAVLRGSNELVEYISLEPRLKPFFARYLQWGTGNKMTPTVAVTPRGRGPPRLNEKELRDAMTVKRGY